MKKVLITGANSYIGVSFENYVHEHYASELSIDTVDMIDGSWRQKDFSSYEVFVKEGHSVEVLTSDYRHFEKVQRSDEKENFKYFHAKPYKKNLSYDRLSSHVKLCHLSTKPLVLDM